MPKLSDEKRELFCIYYAFMNKYWTNATVCKKAGYGNETSSINYLSAQASRLLNEEEVRNRISELQIKYNIAQGDDLVRETIISKLLSILNLDITKYHKSRKVKLKSGRVVQDIFLANSDFSTWDESDRLLVKGFNSKTGLPEFMDKDKALHSLINIFIDKKDLEEQNNNEEAYRKAGLAYVKSSDPEVYELFKKYGIIVQDNPQDVAIPEGDIEESDEVEVETEELDDKDWDDIDCFTDL